MKTLVTGAAGFVGSRLMECSPEMIGVDLRKVSENPRIFVCDVKEEKELEEVIERHEVSQIVHLAGVQYSTYIPPKSRVTFFESNVLMAKTVRKVSENTKIKKIIYVSTDMVYGKDIVSPVQENERKMPLGEYGLSKLEAENILMEGAGYRLSILRPRLIIGRGRVGTIERLAKLIDSKYPVLIIGNGRNRYQFVSVDDVCQAIELLLKSSAQGVFNIGSDNPPTVSELFKAAFENLEIRKRICKLPRSPALKVLRILDKFGVSPLAPEQFELASLDYVLDTCRLKRETGWNPRFSDTQLLSETLDSLLK